MINQCLADEIGNIFSLFIKAATPVIIFFLLYRVQSGIFFEELQAGLRTQKQQMGIKYWRIFLIIRQSAVLTIMVLLRSYAQLQIMMLLMISLIFQILTISLWPFSNKEDNLMQLLNEILISAYLYLCILLTPFNEESVMRDGIGWLLLSTIFANLTASLIKAGYKAWTKIRMWLSKRKESKYLMQKSFLGDLKPQKIKSYMRRNMQSDHSKTQTQLQVAEHSQSQYKEDESISRKVDQFLLNIPLENDYQQAERAVNQAKYSAGNTKISIVQY
ncbi:hypothetical protein FGO68_gene1169 [Halteria grandinella]|uniref:TRP C-terminal domain-containing protein n=1 Tax=Halteria grandinella TaxID=5974 RepID=A0A8J8P7F1_HALGN|nr:hypothetical protein FGO68_gene1169 [Halteria grandinella]